MSFAASAAVFTPEGLQQCREQLAVYQGNAKLMTETLTELGVWHVGGQHSPYVWLACPHGMTSWDFFDALLTRAHVVGTPGSGFGQNGEGFFRLTAFGDAEKTKIAAERIKTAIKAL